MARRQRISILGVVTMALMSTLASAQPEGPARPTLSAGAATTHAGASVAGPGGAEWRIPGGPRVSAEPGAVLRVLHTSQPLQFGPGPSVPGYTLIVKSGKVEVSIPERAKSAIVVVAPRQLGAIVRAGVLRMAALPGSSALANISGVTTVAVNGGAYRELAPGQVLVAAGSTSASRALVSAPKTLAGPRVVITSDGPRRFTGLRWDAVPGATGYHVELLDAATGSVVGRTDVSGPALDEPFEAQPVGRYRLRVSALDPSGIAGARTLDAPLSVVGIALPAGAYVDSSGSIRLGRGQQVQFLGAEGLEMTYGGAKAVRAAKSVGLFRNERTAVHLRMPGSAAFATARLAPRTVRARIELGPRAATWPRDRIEIRVRLEDPSGEPVPEWLEAKPRVRLGVRELGVPFTRRGAWLEGAVAPQPGVGPWVLRVLVEDGSAQTLGYDFVEIAATRSKKTDAPTPPARGDVISRR